MSKFQDLFPALVECFVIILLGYISGRLSIVTPKQAEGIGKFVGTFALPALLFKNMVELDFDTVSWSFMVAVLLGKAVVFLVVLTFSLVMIKRRRLARGALYAIFSTQSNDFALGYPLVKALYGVTHPEFLQYIYLLAPISLLILNPIGFILLEIDKAQVAEREYTLLEQEDGAACDNEREVLVGESIDVVDEDSTVDSNDNKTVHAEKEERPRGFSPRTCLNVVKGVLLNPLVFMVFVGLVAHFALHGSMPTILSNTLGTLANAFSASALFYLGLTMVGKVSKQKGIGLLIPISLIVAKIVLLPILIREFMIVFTGVLPTYRPGDIPQNSTNMTEYTYALANFGYLYGTFPTAPTVVIYAAQYGLEADRLATGMVFCTSLSAPLMYVSAWSLSMNFMSWKYFIHEVNLVDKDISIVSLFCCVWCIVIFVIGRKFMRVPHAVTLSYIFTLFIASLANVLWAGFHSDTTTGVAVFLFALMFFGELSSRFFAASIAIALFLSITRGQRWMWNHLIGLILAPFILASIFTLAVVTTGTTGSPERLVFAYGKSQEIASLVGLSVSLPVTLFFIVATFKLRDSNGSDSRESSPLLRRSSTEISDSEDSVDSGPYHMTICCCGGKCMYGDIQKGRHLVLLLLLTFSMCIGICLVLWRLTGNSLQGVYFEVAFLDSVFNFGQGFLVFCVFGLDSDLIIDPFVRLYQRLRYGSEDISLPDLGTIDRAALLKCHQFTTHHLDDCKLDIVGERRSGLTVYSEVFTGKDLCTWLVDRGLVSDRTEAKLYGQSLLLGRVLYHHNRKHYFYDHKYMYKFEEPKLCQRIVHRRMNRSVPSSPALFRNTSAARDAPSTSSALHVPRSSENTFTPVRRSYFGYSFEAYINENEGQSLTSFRHSPGVRNSPGSFSNDDL